MAGDDGLEPATSAVTAKRKVVTYRKKATRMASFGAVRHDREPLSNSYQTRDLCPVNLCPALATTECGAQRGASLSESSLDACIGLILPVKKACFRSAFRVSNIDPAKTENPSSKEILYPAANRNHRSQQKSCVIILLPPRTSNDPTAASRRPDHH